MNRTRIALLGLAAVLVAVWSSAMLVPPPAATPTAAPAAQPAAKPARDARPRSRAQSTAQPRDVTSFDLNDAAERLHARLAAASRPLTPERNPFEFAPAPTPRRVAEPAPVPVALPVPVGPLPPPFTLTGIAEHKNGEALERTAILSAPSSPGGTGEVYFAKAGEQLLGRYEVTAVGADAIELRELASGQIVRLGLR